MIKIEKFEVVGWEHAIRGMRNPMNSWDKSDSSFKEVAETEALDENGNVVNQQVYFDALAVGPNDHDLMTRLRNAGTDHRKFMRMLIVYADITAPLYWWKEYDTYKVGTVANSCSTMHKIHAYEFTADDFSCEHLLGLGQHYDERAVPYVDLSPFRDDDDCTYSPMGLTQLGIIPLLNACREQYLAAVKTEAETGLSAKDIWWQMIQLLPSSYNQKRTVMLSYEVLANMYKSRKNHKLDEWRELCKWIESLPYSELIIGEEEEKELYELSLDGEGGISGRMMLTKAEAELVARVLNTDNWDHVAAYTPAPIFTIRKAEKKKEEPDESR